MKKVIIIMGVVALIAMVLLLSMLKNNKISNNVNKIYKESELFTSLNMKPSSNYLLLIPNEMINENNKGKQRVELFLNNEYQGNYTIDGIEEIPHKQ